MTSLSRPTPTALSPQWCLQKRDGTGIFVVSLNGALLFRVDIERQLIYAWDKKVGREIQVELDLLRTIKI